MMAELWGVLRPKTIAGLYFIGSTSVGTFTVALGEPDGADGVFAISLRWPIGTKKISTLRFAAAPFLPLGAIGRYSP